MLTNTQRLRPKDKPLADLAIKNLKRCRAAHAPVYAILPPQVKTLILGFQQRQDALIAELYAGRTTFGEYNVNMNRLNGDVAAQILFEASDLNKHAIELDNAGRYSEAEPLYQQSLAIREEVLGLDHPDVAVSLNNLAFLYGEQGRYAEAEPLYKRSLAVNEKTLGGAATLNNLATLYQRQGRYADAEPLFKRSLAINEKAFGPDHPAVALSSNNLALLYQDQGRYTEAEPLFKRALEINEKAFGPNHSNVAKALTNLASLYQKQGRYADAEPLQKRSWAIIEKAEPHRAIAQNSSVWDAADAITLNQQVVDLNKQGRYSEALPLAQNALALREKALGPDNFDVALSLYTLPTLYQNLGRYADAEPLFKRNLAISEKLFGPNHLMNVAVSLNNLAGLYKLQNRYADAEPFYIRSVAIWEKVRPDDWNFAITLTNFADLYVRVAILSSVAEPLLKKSLAIWEKVRISANVVL